jgi:phosphoribosylamine--glycine ligase
MGAYAPVSLDTPVLRHQVMTRIIQPTLHALAADGAPFTGLLYTGLMLTADGPRVVEFNCRFGDPETEAILPLMRSSLLEPVLEVARGGSLVGTKPFEWRDASAVTTVVAAYGYPAQVRTGDRITFPPPENNVYLFHAGTRVPGGVEVPAGEDPPVDTAGGRVLAVTAIAPTLGGAARKSRTAAAGVRFAGKHMRGDIGWRELARQGTRQGA